MSALPGTPTFGDKKFARLALLGPGAMATAASIAMTKDTRRFVSLYRDKKTTLNRS